MNFRQIETFRAVMMSGSASRAAEVLQITQPAVSRATAELEKSIGFALFNRIRGRLVATPEAQLFFKDVMVSFNGLDTLRASAARIRDFGSGSLRIASFPALGSTLVPRAIGAFRMKFPNTAITLQIGSSAMVRDMVASGHFDIGLTADEIDTSGVHHEPFASVRAVCAMPVAHPLARRKVITPGHLHNEAFIALAPEDMARRRLDAILARANAKPNIIVETPYAFTAAALVRAGVGVTLTNPAAIDNPSGDKLVLRPFEPPVYFNSLMLLRTDRQKSRAVKEMLNALLHARFSDPRDINR